MKSEYIKNFMQLYRQSDLELRIRVSGDSMFPILQNHDYVSIKRQNTYRVGDIIVYEKDIAIVHRIVYVERDSNKHEQKFVAKGDNNFIKDPPLCEQAILGRVIAIDHAGKRYAIDTDILQKILTLLSKSKNILLSNTKICQWVIRAKIVEYLQRLIVNRFYKCHYISERESDKV